METSEFLERLLRERDPFEILLNQLGFKKSLATKGVTGGLTVKDLLADILTREQFIADRLSEVLFQEPYAPCENDASLQDFHKSFGYPDYESKLVERGRRDPQVILHHKNIGLDDLVEQELAAFGSIVALLGSLTREQLLANDLLYRVAEQTIRPYRRLRSEVRKWIAAGAVEPK